jgi:hypothetical protein
MPAAGSAGSSAVSRSSTAEGESKREKQRGGAEGDHRHDRGSGESGTSMRKSPDERGVAAAKRKERRTPAVTASYGDA